MRKSFKTALCTILGACIIAAAIAGCSQAGEPRMLDPDRTGTGADNRILDQGLTRNDLVGGRYGYNRLTGNNANTRNVRNAPITRNAGNTRNTANDPSNFLSSNGINTIRYNNRFGPSGNFTGTGTINNTVPNNRMNNVTNTGTRTGTNISTNTGTTGNDNYRASMIERRLEAIKGINDCSVIVSGDTALIGLKTNGTRTGTGNMSGLRTSIERRVKQIDSSIKNVVVTDSPDMLTRMGRLGTVGGNNGMTRGMTTNFMQEFNNMIDSIRNAAR